MILPTPPRSSRSCAVLTLLGLSLAVPCLGHQGGLYPIHELTDDQVALLDLHDGSTGDWLALVGEPSVTLSDFVSHGRATSTGREDLDFRIWLAWHDATDRVFAAVERADDAYTNKYAWGGPCDFMMEYMDSGIGIAIDADHSGGVYSFSNRGYEDLGNERFVRDLQQTAQAYMAIAQTFDSSPKLRSGTIDSQFGHWWYVQQPWADAGGTRFGEQPTITVTELYVTAFNSLDPYDAGVAQIADLRPNRVIGFSLRLADRDLGPWAPPCGAEAVYILPQDDLGRTAETMVDGLLQPASSRATGEQVTAEGRSWARIKLAFDEGRAASE